MIITDDIPNKFPFLSLVNYGNNEYIGLMINQDNYITSMYVYTELNCEEDKKEFLSMGNIWWWESNRLIPINIFLKQEMEKFKYSIINMNTKDVEVVAGPSVSLSKLLIKRIKRKSIQLVKKTK